MFTVVTAVVFILLAPHVAWYINLPLLLVMAVCLLADTASEKKHVRYLAFGYLLLIDVAAPYETSRKDGWNWVAWADLGLVLAATLMAAFLLLFGQENADSPRPAPMPVVRNRPVAAPRRHPARVAALRRQAKRAASRRR